jgi:hypothetical protein
MSQEPIGNETELRRIVRMLEKTTSMAENASLTGSMAGGKEFAVRSYNATLQHLGSTGEISPALFPALPDTASMDEVGIASAQLAEYLRAGLSEPERQDGGSRPSMGDGNVFFNIGGLSEIGDLIRENLPEWLRAKREQKEPQKEGQEAAQSEHPPPNPNPPSGGPAATARAPLPPQRVRIEELRPERQQEEGPR